MNKLTKTVLALSLFATLSDAQSLIFHQDIDDEFNKMQSFISGVMNSNLQNRYFHNNYPQMNVQEKDDSYLLTFNLAGIEKKDIKLSLEENNMLTIEGKQREDKTIKSDSFIKQEMHRGKFKRSILLPDDLNIETLETEFHNGILKVMIEKKVSKKQSAKIIQIN